LLIIAIFIAVPEWNERIRFCLEVVQSSGGILSGVANILLWPYFPLALGTVGFLYVALVGRNVTAPFQHPAIPVVAWISLAPCFVAIVVTVGSGAIEIYIRTEIAKGVAGVPRATSPADDQSRQQRPLQTATRELQPDQIRILLRELPNLRDTTPVLFFAIAPSDTQANQLWMQFIPLLPRSGLIGRTYDFYPRGPEDQGLVLLVADKNNVPRTAQRFLEVLALADIHPEISSAKFDPVQDGKAPDFVFFIAPTAIR
jgi:hypothetical protein